jgi:hypothetical protein
VLGQDNIRQSDIQLHPEIYGLALVLLSACDRETFLAGHVFRLVGPKRRSLSAREWCVRGSIWAPGGASVSGREVVELEFLDRRGRDIRRAVVMRGFGRGEVNKLNFR